MSAGGASLVEQVLERLAEGPAHTLALARDVLGLQGPVGPASAAVFALIGSDPRFEVDAGGTWQLSEAPVGAPLAALSFAVVDVETTGGRAGRGDRITEIAIVEVSAGHIVDEFSTLVNPGRSIPPMIESLTGISDDLVLDAPWFDHVAPEVANRLDGRVFVAHNASFDHRFVQAELLQALGDAPLGPVLCTVQLARALVPDLRRRNLDSLARHFGIPNHARHRAHGDALATARILLRFLDDVAELGIHDLETLQRYAARRQRRRPPVRRSRPASTGPGASPSRRDDSADPDSGDDE